MIDINTLLTAALQQAVDNATAPLLERIADLERDVSALLSRTDHQTASVNVWTQSDITNLYTRLSAIDSTIDARDARLDNLEAQQADAITADQVNHLIETALNNLDWEEQTNEALQNIDLSSYIDIDEAVQEAIANIDWAEQIDLSQLRIVIER